MPIVIDEVRGTVEPEESDQHDDQRRDPGNQPEPPREIEEETLRWNLQHYEQRVLRLRAD
jgi:hypothetical protein